MATRTKSTASKAKSKATSAVASPASVASNIDFLREVPVDVAVEIGRVSMPIGDILTLGPSSIIELAKASNEPLDVRINGVLVAHGEAVVVNERFGIRLTTLVDPNAVLKKITNG